MKKILLVAFFLLFPLSITYAYTLEDVQSHNTTEDCWMIFEEKVYDLSEYVLSHDKFMDIREWCGMDMTEDFKDKADLGRDHKDSSYDLLERYEIGEIEGTNEVELVDAEIVLTEDTGEDAQITEEEDVKKGSQYNLIIPLLISVVTYWGAYFLVKANKFFGISIVKFNAFWNTILLFTLLIPALGFGIFMMIRTQKPKLWDIDFDFLYWHVELSLVMGILGLNHFIQRLGIYFNQLKKR
jgi:cytochrome b involved in lipid metabolism